MINNPLTLSKDHNPNYLATICRIEEVFPIENADRLVKTVINGYDMVISKDMKPGDLVVYFPCETCISKKFLSANNLYERSEFEMNSNAEQVKQLIELAEQQNDESKKMEILQQIKSMCGFFNSKGRVRILKLRGQYSQGFIAGVDSLEKMDLSLIGTDWNSLVGTQFDTINDELLCWKYIIVHTEHHTGSQSDWKKRMRKLKRFDRLIDGQFAFHYNTTMLAEHIKELSPDDIVHITVKIHGTSAIFCNILVKKKLNWIKRFLKFVGFNIQDKEYGNVYASRTTIKNQYINSGVSSGYYNTDVWGVVNEVIKPMLLEGMTVYGEICGYVPGSNKFIQKNHDYGCKVGEWKFMPYRITMTDEQGNKEEWNIDAVIQWTKDIIRMYPDVAKNIMCLTTLYHGRLGDLYPDIPEDLHWHNNVLARMKNDKQNFLMELDEPLCTENKVPREGIVIRIDDDIKPRAWKLKTLRHYGKEAEENDSGEENIEDMN